MEEKGGERSGDLSLAARLRLSGRSGQLGIRRAEALLPDALFHVEHNSRTINALRVPVSPGDNNDL